jgi:predicted DNA-binding transcriptional regulator AlpA
LPAPRQYGTRSLRWDADEVEAWLRDPAAWRAAQKAKLS